MSPEKQLNLHTVRFCGQDALSRCHPGYRVNRETTTMHIKNRVGEKQLEFFATADFSLINVHRFLPICRSVPNEGTFIKDPSFCRQRATMIFRRGMADWVFKLV